MYVLDKKNDNLKKVIIEVVIPKEIKVNSKKFEFDWYKLAKQRNSITYSLKFNEATEEILGLLNLTNIQGMLIMNMVEVTKENIGKEKNYDYIAGCLIAFACQQSFDIDSNYKGFLTFNAKSELINLYKIKYFAKQINGQRMYIEPENGVKLIDEYLNRKK